MLIEGKSGKFVSFQFFLNGGNLSYTEMTEMGKSHGKGTLFFFGAAT
jgi:hypothetical protein